LDPDEYVKSAGPDAYRGKLEKAPGYFNWLADRARSRYDMRTAQGRVSALQFLLPAIQRVSDKLERAAIANDLAGYLGVDRGLVLDHFKRAAVDRREKPMEIAREPVRAVEKILLNSLLLSGETRREIIPRLRGMPEIEQFRTRRILQSLFALHDNQPQFRFAELEARLEEPDRALLSSVVFADELGEENYTLEQALACLRRLEGESRESQRALLRKRVKEAEGAGDLAEALRLAEELGRLEKTTS
jgi:DNA primase